MLSKLGRSKSLRNLRVGSRDKDKDAKHPPPPVSFKSYNQNNAANTNPDVNVNHAPNSISKGSGNATTSNTDNAIANHANNSNNNAAVGSIDRVPVSVTATAAAISKSNTVPVPTFRTETTGIAQTETLPHGPFSVAASAPRDLDSVSAPLSLEAESERETAPDVPDMGSAHNANSGSDDRAVSVANAAVTDTSTDCDSGLPDAGLDAHSEKHKQHDHLEGVAMPNSTKRSAFLCIQNGAIPSRSRSMREVSDKKKNRRAVLDGTSAFNLDSASKSASSLDSFDSYDSSLSVPSSLDSFPSRPSISRSASFNTALRPRPIVPSSQPSSSPSPSPSSSEATSISASSSSSSPPLNISSPVRSATLPVPKLPATLSIRPTLIIPISQSTTSTPTATTAPICGLKRATSTKHFDADRSRRHDLVSPLRLSPPDVVASPVTSDVPFPPRTAPLVSAFPSSPTVATPATTAPTPVPATTTASQIKRSQSTRAPKKAATLTSPTVPETPAPSSASLLSRKLSIKSAKRRLLLPPSRPLDSRPSTSSGVSPFKENPFSTSVSPFSASTSALAFGTVTTISASADGDITEDISEYFPRPPRTPTDPNMTAIPRSPSSASMLKPRFDANKRISRDDLYINTRTSRTTYRSYHVPIRGRAPSPKESPGSEVPAVTLVRTQTPDSLQDTGMIPIGMALGSPSFAPANMPASIASVTSTPSAVPVWQPKNVVPRTREEISIPASTITTATAEPPADASNEKNKKWRLFRSRSRRGTERNAQPPPMPTRKVSDGEEAIRPTTSGGPRDVESVQKVVSRPETDGRVTPEEVAIFQPRMGLKRSTSSRSLRKAETPVPITVNDADDVPAMPEVNVTKVAVPEIVPMPFQSKKVVAPAPPMPSGFLPLNLPDPKLERYSVMFNGILEREGVPSTAQKKAEAQKPTSAFVQQQASLLARRQATLDRLKEINAAIEKEHDSKMRKMTRNRSATSPVSMVHPTNISPPMTATTPGKSPAFSLFPATPSQPKMPARPSSSSQRSTPEPSPREAEAKHHHTKAVPKPLILKNNVSEVKVDVKAKAADSEIKQTDILMRPRMHTRSNSSPASPTMPVPFRFVDPSKPIPKNMPRLRYRNIPPADSVAGPSMDSLAKRVMKSDMERPGSSGSDRTPILMGSTDAFPQPPSHKKQPTPTKAVAPAVATAPAQAQVPQPHRARSPPRARSQSPSMAKPVENPALMTLPATSFDPQAKHASPLGPNRSALVLDSEDEATTPKTAAPPAIMVSGPGSAGESMHSRSESAMTASSIATTSSLDNADIALRNAVEISIARQISISRQHRQMLKKSGLIMASPTVATTPGFVGGSTSN